MDHWAQTVIKSGDTILRAVEVIDKSTLGVALVVDGNNRLLGVVTDGDVRRALLRKIDLGDRVDGIMSRDFQYVREHEGNDKILFLMRQKTLSHIPVLDDQGRIKDLKVLREMIAPKRKDNLVVIMAGGLGTRLRPMTDDCPKPLLSVGGKPLLETIIEKFTEFGFYRFSICINYKGHMIEDYFGNGTDMGVEIDYVREEKRLGTAGPLGILPRKPEDTFIVINGDLLTTVNFEKLLEFHRKNQSKATMCVRTYESQVPYGVVEVENSKMVAIVEKPVQKCLVNAGIYALEPSVLDMIPAGEYFDMPMVFQELLNSGVTTAAFPVREYWLDIGQKKDFEKAHGDYPVYFHSERMEVQ